MESEDVEERLEMVRDFVNESRELLDIAEPQIIDMERTAASGRVDEEILNEVFRLFHSLKGTAAFLDLQNIISVTHEAETLLDIIRKKGAYMTPEHVDLLCRTSDFIRKALDRVESQLNDEGFEAEAEFLINDFRNAIAPKEETAPPEAGDAVSLDARDAALPDAPEQGSGDESWEAGPERDAAAAAGEEEATAAGPGDSLNLPGMDLLLTPEMSRRFAEESLELCEEAEMALLGLEKAVDDEFASRAFRAFHSIKGNAGFFGYGDIERLSHLAENVLDGIREQKRPCDDTTMSVLLCVLDAVRNKLTGAAGGANPGIPNFQQLCDTLEKIVAAPESDPIVEPPASEQEATASSQSPRRDADAAGVLLDWQNGEEYQPDEAGRPKREVAGTEPDGRVPDPHPLRGYPEQVSRREADANKSRTAPAPAGCPPEPQASKMAGPGGVDASAAVKQQASASVQQVIRVDIDKLDKLLDLVGELVIAEAMVTNDPKADALKNDRTGKAFLQLDKISREIQEVAMSMRMIPLAGVFRRMLRLVRDLANKANKQVELEIIGEETEVDKTIIEQISDPLVHLIRNAVDHGIESAAVRQRAGKPETGKVTIEAKHSAGEVWITVEDDGGGLNREKVFRKGLEKGLIREEDRDMKDGDLWRLIFEPGFSTAEQVSNISGRGVGMDVVRQNIEKLRGKIDLRSKPGVGTMFAIRIPLTLAIIEGMVIRVGANRYIIPISSIKESFRPRPDQITCTPDQLEIVRIRGELLPIARLHQVYHVEPSYEDLNRGILIYVDSNDSKCCLFVDELIGQQQIVIKGLPAYLNRVRGISGCAIMGDGEVGMILDIADLISSIEMIAS